MTRLSPFAFAAAIVATGLSVMASSPAAAATAHVRYSDLDLAAASGRATLARRIDRAAQTVCWIENADIRATRSCRLESVAAAREALRHAMQEQAVTLAAR
jgi:UrcA family protein